MEKYVNNIQHILGKEESLAYTFSNFSSTTFPQRPNPIRGRKCLLVHHKSLNVGWSTHRINMGVAQVGRGIFGVRDCQGLVEARPPRILLPSPSFTGRSNSYCSNYRSRRSNRSYGSLIRKSLTLGHNRSSLELAESHSSSLERHLSRSFFLWDSGLDYSFFMTQ